MNYNLLKIIHIISASGFLAGCGSQALSWTRKALTAHRAIFQTAAIILPTALFQLTSGCILISLHHPQLIEPYILMALSGFTGFILSWFGFIYILLSQPSARRTQGGFLIFSVLTLITMVFAMSNMVSNAS